MFREIGPKNRKIERKQTKNGDYVWGWSFLLPENIYVYTLLLKYNIYIINLTLTNDRTSSHHNPKTNVPIMSMNPFRHRQMTSEKKDCLNK